jgi:hypothetical protein
MKSKWLTQSNEKSVGFNNFGAGKIVIPSGMTAAATSIDLTGVKDYRRYQQGASK